MAGNTHNPSTRQTDKEDYYKFEISLVYTVSPRTAWYMIITYKSTLLKSYLNKGCLLSEAQSQNSNNKNFYF